MMNYTGTNGRFALDYTSHAREDISLTIRQLTVVKDVFTIHMRYEPHTGHVHDAAYDKNVIY